MKIKATMTSASAAAILLVLSGCAGDDTDTAGSSSSSSPTSSTSGGAGASPDSDPSASSEGVDEAEEAVGELPTFSSAYAAFSGKELKGYWQDELESDMAEYGDSEAAAREYSVTCDKEDQETTAGRDPVTSDVVKGTKMTCWIDSTEEEVNIIVFDKTGPEADECVYPDDINTCFIGNRWVLWAESHGAMRDTAVKMGVDPELVEEIEMEPEDVE